jgi:hypothetical protein
MKQKDTFSNEYNCGYSDCETKVYKVFGSSIVIMCIFGALFTMYKNK